LTLRAPDVPATAAQASAIPTVTGRLVVNDASSSRQPGTSAQPIPA
jgi:hypothetical protein